MSERTNRAAAGRTTEPVATPRRWLLAALVALLVVQVLLPADGTTPAAGAAIPQAMLWLVLTACWLAAVVWRAGRPLRFTATDLALLVLVALIVFSGVRGAWLAAPRPSINATWSWVAIACGYFLVRQLVQAPREIRALVTVMIALGAGLSCYGIYQVTVEIPETRRIYQQDPEGHLLRALGVVSQGQIDPQTRRQFEARLFSPEPFAMFLLANSLAVFLTAWLIVALGMLLCWNPLPDRNSATRWSVALVAALMAATLYLTRSRAAWLATGTAAAAAGGWWLSAGRSFRLRAGLAALAGGAVLMFATAAIAWRDGPAAADARTSWTFRREYWQATWQLILDDPWLGCGPGNFQATYTAYKLPQALEEVGDPHNFLLEVGATAGMPAALVLLAALVLFFRQVVARGRPGPPEGDRPGEGAGQAGGARFVLIGAAAGLVVAWILAVSLPGVIESALTIDVLLWIGLPGLAVLALLGPWIRDGRLTPGCLALGAGGLLIALSASGGIGNPGVAGSLWLLIALALNLCQSPAAAVPRLLAAVAVASALCAAGLCYVTAYGPLVHSTAALRAAESLAAAGSHEDAGAALRAAVRADPRNAAALRQLARRSATDWFAQLGPAGDRQLAAQRRDELDSAVAAWLAADPRSASARREVGDMYFGAYRVAGDEAHLSAARDRYRQAIDRYPQDAMLHAQLAWVHHLMGAAGEAARAARRALELDGQTPHHQRKLDNSWQRFSDPEIPSTELVPLLRKLQVGASDGSAD